MGSSMRRRRNVRLAKLIGLSCSNSQQSHQGPIAGPSRKYLLEDDVVFSDEEIDSDSEDEDDTDNVPVRILAQVSLYLEDEPFHLANGANFEPSEDTPLIAKGWARPLYNRRGLEEDFIDLSQDGDDDIIILEEKPDSRPVFMQCEVKEFSYNYVDDDDGSLDPSVRS